jgi:hypothetical protein
MYSRTALFLALPALACLLGTAQAAPASAPHAAACVAALKARESSLAQSVKAGAPAQSELLEVVRSGIAIIGAQYLAGLQEAEARRLLDAAEQDFQTLPRSTADERQAQCQREGHTLYRGASPLEQALITNSAQRRIRRLTAA